MRVFNIKSLTFTFLITMLISCEEVEIVVDPYPLSEVDFSFLQASNKLYISTKALKKYQDSSLDSIMVLWHGTNISNTADTLKLIDDGTLGDLIPKDEIFSRKINNLNLYLKNIIPPSAKDSVFLSIIGQYENKELILPASFILGNIRPKLTSVMGVQDTIIKPSVNQDPNIINTIEFSLMATVSDPNGLDDIKRVFFRSYNVDLDSMMYNGNPVFLYDDGTGADGSGDLQKGDGTYTRTISMTQDARSGTYHWSFEAQDFSNAYSDTIKKVVLVK
jgi:hypothetical protein